VRRAPRRDQSQRRAGCTQAASPEKLELRRRRVHQSTPIPEARASGARHLPLSPHRSAPETWIHCGSFVIGRTAARRRRQSRPESAPLRSKLAPTSSSGTGGLPTQSGGLPLAERQDSQRRSPNTLGREACYVERGYRSQRRPL
jgi:hypothetical protein